MFNRRHIVGFIAAAAVLSVAGTANAQDWKSKFPELILAAVPDENASGMTDRYTPFTEYLSRELGVPVRLRVANDYAAVIEGQKSGNIHIAQYGPASYARAYMIGAEIEPFGMMVNADGGKGYHAVLYVKADSSFQSIEDLKGKNLCLVDPNSTSGNNVPRFAMDKLGIDPEQYFSKVVYAGSHENAVIGVQQGTCDAAWNWWNDENESNLHRMDRKGMAKYADFRIVMKSDKIVNSPVAYLNSLPDDLKAAIRDAFFNVAKKDPAAWQKLTDGKQQPWDPTSHADYEAMVELTKFVDNLKRKRG
ncbi:MAG: phosphonate ABC transporter substrate-binding protein [Hyphomicrobiaceae bacterium]